MRMQKQEYVSFELVLISGTIGQGLECDREGDQEGSEYGWACSDSNLGITRCQNVQESCLENRLNSGQGSRHSN